MKAPKVIKRNNRKYIFIKRTSKGLNVYRELRVGYKECFDDFDLGIVKKRRKINEINPERVIFL